MLITGKKKYTIKMTIDVTFRYFYLSIRIKCFVNVGNMDCFSLLRQFAKGENGRNGFCSVFVASLCSHCILFKQCCVRNLGLFRLVVLVLE